MYFYNEISPSSRQSRWISSQLLTENRDCTHGSVLKQMVQSRQINIEDGGVIMQRLLAHLYTIDGNFFYYVF